jgi:hypothetical protein
LISSGLTISEFSIGYHNINRDVSSSSILFTEDNPIMILPLPQTTVKPVEDSNIYDECSKSKSCIGIPNGCLGRQDCLVFGAVIVKNGVYEFEMVSPSKYCTIYFKLILTEH